MASRTDEAYGRLFALAAVTGMRAALGPALLAASRRAEGREALALAAMAELVIDKLPFTPSRSSLPVLMSRVLAGYWVGSQLAEEDDRLDAWAGPIGAAVAGGVSLLAPSIRWAVGGAFRVPDALVGLAEDALALSVGRSAAGLSNDELQSAAGEAVGLLREGRIGPAVEQLKGRLLPTR